MELAFWIHAANAWLSIQRNCFQEGFFIDIMEVPGKVRRT
jgi:hypothetical protein